MFVVGIDLSGPANVSDTVCVVFEGLSSSERLIWRNTLDSATDENLFESVTKLAGQGEVIVGLDAPLSYNVGGGDRPADKELRKQAVAAGLNSGTVMTPTMTRMAYLTLRGICVARLLSSVTDRIVEVHPGCAMALRGASSQAVRSMKQEPAFRHDLLRWLEKQGLADIPADAAVSDHFVCACASALAAWRWHSNDAKWSHSAKPPFHPFDFSC